MKKNFAKITSLALAMLMAVPASTGCGKQNEYTDRTDETKGQGEIILDEDGMVIGDILYNSYRQTEKIEYKQKSMKHPTAVGNKLILTSSDDEALYCYHTDTKEMQELHTKCEQEKEASHLLYCEVLDYFDGRIGILCMVSKYVNGYETEVVRTCIEVYDEKLQYIETIEIPKEISHSNFLSRATFSVDGKGNYYIHIYDQQTGQFTLECYNKNFEKYGSIPYPTDSISYRMFQGGNGEVFFKLTKGSKSGDSYEKVYRLDAEARTCTEVGMPAAQNGVMAPSFCGGTGEYAYYYSDDHGIYGVRDNTVTCVVNFINSDIPLSSVTDFAALPNGDFYLWTFNPDGFKEEYVIITQRTAEEFENTEIITLSTVGMYDILEETVVPFNRQNNGVRIILQDYAFYNTKEDQTLGHAKLREDMLDGILADIVCTDGMNFESLTSKGLFADWYELMDADPEFNRSDYLENYFKSMEYGGKLQKMGISFHVRTALAKSEHVGDKAGRTLAEMMALPSGNGMQTFGFEYQDLAKEFWFSAALNSFIDRDKAKCYFDSPEFVKLLEMLKTYSTDKYTGIYELTHVGDQPPLRDAMAYRENRLLVEFATISQPIDYHAKIRTTFGDAPVAFVGYPTVKGGNGGVFQSDFTLSVNAQSKKKDAVWSFMKHLLSEKYQKSLNTSLPVHKAVLDNKIELGTKQFMANAIFNGTNVNIGAASPESMQALSDYIYQMDTAFYSDPVVTKILTEEADMFLAGDQSAEQAAKMMQSRVSIYLSEQS